MSKVEPHLLERRRAILSYYGSNARVTLRHKQYMARAYDVPVRCIESDITALKRAGCIKSIAGTQGVYEWLKPYNPNAPERKTKTTTTMHCMCCGRAFQSEGKHNRLCKTCRTKSGSWSAEYRVA